VLELFEIALEIDLHYGTLTCHFGTVRESPMSSLIRSASLTNFPEIASQCGLDPTALLREVGLSLQTLKQPDLKIEALSVVRLIENAAVLAHEPALGLRMGESRRLSNLGPLGMLLRDEPTLRDVLNAMVRHIRTHNEALIVVTEEVDDLVMIKMALAIDADVPVTQSIELAMAVTFRTFRFFMGANWHPRMVCFSHSAPAQLSAHKRLFGEAISFNQEFNGLICNLSDLSQPNPSADPQMSLYTREFFQTKAISSHSLTSQVQQLILMLLPLGQCRADIVAHHLGCDRRTVTRRLAIENTSFHLLVNEQRRRMAHQLMTDRSHALSQVAGLLGFSSPSSFSRWYKSEFGSTPSRA
jgi:AraC-like DNA-binding protein